MQPLQAFQVIANLGVRPVGVAYDFAADYALAVDDVSFRPAVGAVQLRNLLVGIAYGVQIDVIAVKETAIGALVLVDADGEYGEIGAITMELHEGGGLLNAGRALAPPQVQQNDLASIVREPDGVFAVADCEIRSEAIGVSRACAAVATRGYGERNQRPEGNETRKPHILIIRSGRFMGKGHESHGA